MKKQTKNNKLLVRLIGIIFTVFIIILLVEVITYFSFIITDASISKICFYSVLMIMIAYKLGNWLKEPLEAIITGKWPRK